MPSKKSPQKAFEHVLRCPISLDDSEWNFTVPGLPSSQQQSASSLMKMVSLKTNSSHHSLVLRLGPISPCRALIDLPIHQCLLISFSDFHAIRTLQTETSNETPNAQPTTARECSDYIIKLLCAGICIQDVQYNFYGHSNSQLKSRTCFLLAATKEDITKRVESMGDFSKMKSVAKKVKRIGLLFSNAKVVLDVDPTKVEDIPDVEVQDYIFTDGCGLIAPRFAQDISRRLRIAFRDQRYTPSVFQIRYRGYKGVVTVDPLMKKGKSWLKLRKSMKKFSGGNDYSFSVVDYSKPFAYGHLNDEVIILLNALGIDRETLKRKQSEHYEFLKSAVEHPRCAFRFLCYLNMPELAERVILDSLDSVRPTIERLINTEYDKMLNKRDEQRCRILIRQSRLLFGVCDSSGVLKPGQCAVKVTMEEDGQPYALKGMKVLVTRNPCLHPGDLQKLDVVQRPELDHLVDCIVFPIKGARPAADMMSGGDLDGDTFFVSWDPDIIPSIESQAAMYPGSREPIKFGPISDDDRLQFFARYTNASLGRIKNLYLRWARVTGALSRECQELNRLFSQCVDGNRVKNDQLVAFESPPEPGSLADTFILDELHAEAAELITRAIPSNGSLDGQSIDGIEAIFARDDIAISEFDLIRLALKWCKKEDFPFVKLLHWFDFNSLKAEEKAWILCQIPESPSISNLVLNALHSSDLVHEEELRYFRLQSSALHWKRIYTSAHDRLATFLDCASTALEIFDKKLIVFRPDDRLTLAIYIPHKITRSDDCLVHDKVRLLAFPHAQEMARLSRLSLPTKKNYRLYCDDNIFQLFEGHRRNTWVFIQRAAADDSSYRNHTRVRDRRKARQESLAKGLNFDFRASVALDKFSQALLTQIGRVNRNGVLAAEIYVISNRDTHSMNCLDLWEKYIDSDTTVPLFDQKPKEYTLPDLKNIDWDSEDRLIAEIAQKRNFIALHSVCDSKKLETLFHFLLGKAQHGLVMECCECILGGILSGQNVAPKTNLEALLTLVDLYPCMAAQFTRLHPWSELPEDQSILLENFGLLLLQNILLSEYEYGELITVPFQTILKNIHSLSFEDFTLLMESVALTVRSPEVAMDILLGGLDSQATRLLPGETAVIQHFTQNMKGIVLEHVCEAQQERKMREELFDLELAAGSVGHRNAEVEIPFRIDAPVAPPELNAHVRLSVASLPVNSFRNKNYSISGLVKPGKPGQIRVLCFHPVPFYFKDCSWRLEHCGPFVTAKTMFDAVRDLAMCGRVCCGIANQIVGGSHTQVIDSGQRLSGPILEPSLNYSQVAAIDAVDKNPLTCLWGPPGTGKTQTIVAMIRRLQSDPKCRILVTAPTHNAVDNVLRRYIDRLERENLMQSPLLKPIRVSTEIRKVAGDLHRYTCDALAGKEIYSDFKALAQAKKRVKEAQIIFTTCIGAGIGLLRDQIFDIAIVDEASQQTEPASVVPLVKGCAKAILVGDHVQLRPTVQPMAASVEYDVSLFERLYTRDDSCKAVAKIMLDTQYRMHPDISSFISREFYENKLKSGVDDHERPLPVSSFPWPTHLLASSSNGASFNQKSRMVFVECKGKEDFGKSKANQAQADLCLLICKLLRTKPLIEDNSSPQEPGEAQVASIAVLTPYSRQAELLKKLVSGITNVEVSSIDGFQGREADIVVFITVRCNESLEIGFLKDLRRMNVALTRARAGLIVVGNKTTLRGGQSDEESAGMWKRLMERLPTADLSLPV